MNKNRYRIVFNKARNMMMAVAENTTNQGKGQQSGTGQPSVPEKQRGANAIELFRIRTLTFAALCAFGMQPVLLQAAVIADTNAAANNKPVIDSTANGLPLVQITTPSAAGVSRNQYSQFNVDTNGVILNNSQGNVLTQQGGYVGGNPYLASGSARIILNEVTGTGASSLRGYTEVAGQRAEVVIANPNGIVCDGCGFINTSRGILTTGVPMMGSGGSLDSFRVTGGQIRIGSGGLNASNVDQLDLITRSLQVNGEIWANSLNAVVGANKVDYATLGVQVIAGDANKPTVGIDVALLGGMYANKIRLVGTEAGVGVNSLGTMAAQAGNFTLDNQGNITLGGHTSATADLSINSHADIVNSGTLEGGTVTSTGNAFSNSGSILAETLKIGATSLNNQGTGAILSGNTSLKLTVSGDINNEGILTGSAVTLQSNAFSNGGAVLADAIKINAASLSNQGTQAKIAANTSVDLTVNGAITNAGTISGPTVNTQSSAFNNSGTVLANAFALNATSLHNQGANAIIVGSNSINLTVNGDIVNEGIINGSAVTSSSNAFNNSGSVLTNDLSLKATSLNNQGTAALISGNNTVDLLISGGIVNGGTVTGGMVTTSGNVFNNSGAVLANDLIINASNLSNQGPNAKIAGNNSANLMVAGDINNASSISGGTVTSHSQAFNNSGTVLTNALDIYATSLDNLGANANILGKTALGLTISGDINNTGTLTGDAITSHSMAFTNTGVVLANTLALNATSLNNQGAGAQIAGNNSANLSVSGYIVNDGTIMGGSITSTSNAFTNSATGALFGDMVTLNANSLLNQAATSIISGHTSLDLNIAGDINNIGTLDGNTVTAYSNTFNNTGGVFGNDVTLNAATLNNTGNTAVIATTHALNLIVSGTINNTDGATLYSLGDLNAGASSTLDAAGYLSKNMVSFNNTSATVQADGDLRISADQITNKRRFVQVDSTTTTSPDVKTVTTDEHKIVSFVPDVVNPDGSTTYGYATTVDIHTVAQVQGGTNVLSQTVTQTETVTQSPDPAILGWGYIMQWSAYNTIITPTKTSTISCQPCYSPTVATDSVNASTSTRSNMLAGGNMHLKGNINNEYSTIAAGHDINFNANGPQTLTSGAYIVPDPALTGVITTSANGYTQLSQVLVTTESQIGTTDSWQWVVVGGHDDCYPCHWQEDYGWRNFPLPYANTVTTPLNPSVQTLSASFTAGNNIAGSAGYVNNHTTNANKTSATLGALQTNTTAALNPNSTTSTSSFNITLPTNSMFTYHTAPNQPYLIETNPRFTSYNNFLSSDYMLSRLTLDPQQTQKRLGDGFYEQKLVTDEITKLTGRRFLPGYTSAEAEFKAMMEQGLAEAHTQNLVPGVALTSAQTAALTHDIVWMVAQEVTMADGTKEKVLVPQVFLTRLHEKDLRPNGSLIAAENIDIKTSGTLQNSGTILGSKTTALAATDVVNKGGTVSSGGDTVIVASNDIKNLSGTINGVRVAVLAGHDVVNDTEMEGLQLGNVFTTRIHNTASITAADTLDIRAGHDVSITGAKVTAGGNASIAAGNNFTVSVLEAKETAHLASAPDKGAVNPDGSPNLQYALAEFNRGDNGPSGGISATVNLTSQIQTGGNLTLVANNDISMTAAQIYAMQDLSVAARNITLGAAKDVAQSSFNDHSSNNTSRTDEKVIGTVLQAGNNVQLTASGNKPEQGNITISGSQISSQSGKVALAADNNVTVNAVDERHDFYQERTSHSSGFLSSSSTTEITKTNEKIARGSSIDGASITVKTGHDINVTGSDIVATNELSLEAKNNIALLASENTYSSSYFKDEQKSGLMSGGGLSISYGEQKQKNLQTSTDISHTASNIGSLNGNVNIKAGKDYTQTGSNVSTPAGDINIAAQEVVINEVQNTGISHSETKFEQSGLTLSLSNAVVDAANTVEQQRKAGGQTSSGRMKALAAANALMSGTNAVNSVMDDATGNLSDKVGVSFNISVGGSSSESSSTQTYSKAQGSSVTAGGNINIVATSAGEDEHHADHGSDESDKSFSTNKRGNITIQGSNIKAGKDTTLEAENDINLLAAKSTAEQHSTNSSSSGSIGVGISVSAKGGGLTGTASASAARGNADGSDVTWTNTHLDAGNTLTIKSGRDTNMKGAVASGNQVLADIGGNLNVESLQDTSTYDSQQTSRGGSLSVAIIGSGSGGSVNAADTKINSNYASVMEQSGIKAGDGGFKVNVKGDTDLKGAVIAASDEGLEKSTFKTGGTLTQSDIQNSASYDAESIAMSAGVGDKASASAGVGSDSGNASSTTKSGIGVSTKTDTTGAIAKIFDANKVTEEVNAQVQITQTFSQLAPKAVADFADKRVKPFQDASDFKELADKQKQGNLSPSEQLRLSQLEQQGMTPDRAQATLDNPQSKEDYDNWKEGGVYRVTLHTVSGALSGGLNGAAGALTTASAAPLLDELQSNVQASLVSHGMSEEKAKLVAQGVAEVTSAGMGAAVGGLQGAATGLTVDTNNRQLHPTEIQKIKSLKAKFADENHITPEEAETRLMAQALRDTDKEFHDEHAQPDVVAENYLRANASSFTDESGKKMLTFAPMGSYEDSGMYADTRQTYAKEYAAVEKKAAFVSQDERTSKINADTRDTILKGGGKGVVNLPGDIVNGVTGVVSLLPYVPSMQLPQLLPYSNEVEAQVGADTQAVGLTAFAVSGAIRATAIPATTIPTIATEELGFSGGGSFRYLSEESNAAVGSIGGNGVEASNILSPYGTTLTDEFSALSKFNQNSVNRSYQATDLNVNERGLMAQERIQAQDSGWVKPDGSTWWPPYDGAIPGTQRMITYEPSSTGSSVILVDRYGNASGSYVSPAGVPLDARALSNVSTSSPSVYSVDGVIEGVERSNAASWFGQRGTGVQDKLPGRVQYYLDIRKLGEH